MSLRHSGLLFLLAAPSAFADPVDDELAAALKTVKAPGVSVMAAKDGKVMLEKGYGLANVEHKVPMTKDSVHELASVSKQFTAVAILLLAQDGKLGVEDKISKYFPGQGDDWDKITVLHLLHHTSGLPDYLEVLADISKDWTAKQMAEAVGNKPLNFEPGSKFEYSNTGYMLLGLIIEKASGKGLGEFVKTRLFEPTKMSKSRLNTMAAVVPGLAYGYDPDDKGGWVRETFTSESLCVTGDGEIMSTVGDLWKWNEALHHGKILDAKHYEIFITPTKVSAQNGSGYACGIIVIERNGVKVFSHSGGWTGTTTTVSYNPTSRLFYAVLCNMGGADPGPVLSVLRKHFD